MVVQLKTYVATYVYVATGWSCEQLPYVPYSLPPPSPLAFAKLTVSAASLNDVKPGLDMINEA